MVVIPYPTGSVPCSAYLVHDEGGGDGAALDQVLSFGGHCQRSRDAPMIRKSQELRVDTLRIMEPLDEEQVRVLTYVRISPGITVSKLARLVRATPTVIGRRIEILEAQGLLERRNHPDHPNANELHVTTAGVAALGTES